MIVSTSGSKKQFRGEAGWLEWHRQKMPMRPTVRLVAMGFQVIGQNREERFMALVN
jgi:hypothetical protein